MPAHRNALSPQAPLLHPQLPHPCPWGREANGSGSQRSLYATSAPRAFPQHLRGSDPPSCPCMQGQGTGGERSIASTHAKSGSHLAFPVYGSLYFSRGLLLLNLQMQMWVLLVLLVPGKAPPGLAQVVRVQRQEEKKMAVRKTCEGFWLFSVRKLMPASQGMGSDIGCQMQSALPFHGNNYDSEIFS